MKKTNFGPNRIRNPLKSDVSGFIFILSLFQLTIIIRTLTDRMILSNFESKMATNPQKAEKFVFFSFPQSIPILGTQPNPKFILYYQHTNRLQSRGLPHFPQLAHILTQKQPKITKKHTNFA